MSRDVRWIVFKDGKPVPGVRPFRDVYAAYLKAQQVKGTIVKALSVRGNSKR